MTESGKEHSSMESLPMSQETLNTLMSMIDSVPTFQDENYIHRPSSLPATSNWLGDYNFRVMFGAQEPINKKTSWTYSEEFHKLYVKKDFPCPINFSTDTSMMEGDTFIRVMAFYSSPKDVHHVVTRCVNHSKTELEKGIPEAEHLIRSESSSSHYIVDSETHHHSVIVPYENPPAGQSYSTYLYKFACYGSCPGGPNRRPIKLVFTLEQRNVVVGRCAFDLKICACPGRDRMNDETPKTKVPYLPAVPVEAEEPTASASKRIQTSDETSSTSSLDTDEKRMVDVCTFGVNPNEKQNRVYTIKVTGLNRYNFLKQMDEYYRCQQVLRASPHVSPLFCVFRSSSDEDSGV